MKRFLAIALLAASCAHAGPLSTPGTARTDTTVHEAAALIWESYGGDTPAPLVRVATGSDLTCTDPNSGARGFECPNVGCREGCTLLDSVVSWDGLSPWSATALSHELLHQLQERMGIVDPNHRRIEWQPGGPVDKANQRLREHDM